MASHLGCPQVAHFLPPCCSASTTREASKNLLSHSDTCTSQERQGSLHLTREHLTESGDWSSHPIHLDPPQSIFWCGWSAEMGIWRAGVVVVRMGRKWGKFTLCHLPAWLAPRTYLGREANLAIQPYKEGLVSRKKKKKKERPFNCSLELKDSCWTIPDNNSK